MAGGMTRPTLKRIASLGHAWQHVENPVGHPHLRPFPVRIVSKATFIQARVESFKHDRALATATRKGEETTALVMRGIRERVYAISPNLPTGLLRQPVQN